MFLHNNILIIKYTENSVVNQRFVKSRLASPSFSKFMFEIRVTITSFSVKEKTGES